MLKKCFALLFAVISFFSFDISVFAESMELSALSAVVYCKETGEVLFEKNGRQQRSMASTTKIMTSLIALESAQPYLVVTITPEMVNVEGTSSGLRAGDRIRLIDLVYCMLLESGNDAANSVAIALGGSFDAFAVMMNEKARSIGMNDTSFVTPSGLDDKNHYTTAYDMALLTAYALGNEEFALIAAKESHTVNFVGSDKQVTLHNHNKLLNMYDGCVGVKTGYTKKSGRCLVSAAKRSSVTIIAVTLNAGDDWNDHIKMLDYGFNKVKTKSVGADLSRYGVLVVGSSDKSVPVCSEEIELPYTNDGNINITYEICLEKFLYAPVNEGDVVGSIKYYADGEPFCEALLTASCSAY